MRLFENRLYLKHVEDVAVLPFPWAELQGKTILISGASGLIGSFLIDVIMYRNRKFGNDITIIALGRTTSKITARFAEYLNESTFIYQQQNICLPLCIEAEHADFIVHAASNTHPLAYSGDPIGTITANIIGLNNLLCFAADHHTKRFLFLSSVEVYGENRGDVEKFSEDYCGYINCNTLRSGYPESKRAGESLCQAYRKQAGLDIVIPRLSRTYGPTMLSSDTKAISQFIKKGISGEDIVLKSAGNQFYSYSYVADAVSGMLVILFYGKNGEAYNIADEKSDISLKDLATLIAQHVGRHVVFELPDKSESLGYSTATRAVMDPTKLTQLGWKAMYDIKAGITGTIEILRAI